MTNQEYTQKVEGWRLFIIDKTICELLGISKPTLYTRLKKSNWKKGEKSLIDGLSL